MNRRIILFSRCLMLLVQLLLLLLPLLFDRKEEDVMAAFGGNRMGEGNKDELECYTYVLRSQRHLYALVYIIHNNTNAHAHTCVY